MAQDRPRKPGPPAWKAAAGGPQKADPAGPKYAWKPHEEVAPSRWGRRAKLAGAFGGAIGCVAGIIALILWLRAERGACLVLVGANPYDDIENLAAPLDAYGWRGGRRMAEYFSDAYKAERTHREPLTPKLIDDSQLDPESIRADGLKSLLQKLDNQRRETLIVYFGLHGGADPTGPFLFTGGGGRLYLHDLIEGIGESDLRKKKIVLLIDSARMTPDPALGVLFPDCVRGLKALDAAGEFDKVPNLVMICATDAGERGWSAEEWGTTGFAEMVRQGLGGGASNGTLVTAADLFTFVRDQTQSWSRYSRPTAQTPILLPSKDGSERARQITVSAKVGGHVDEWPTATPFPPPPALIEHWTQCKKLEDGMPSPAVYTPRLWRRYRELLLRYEYLLKAGEGAAADKLAEKLAEAEQGLKNGRGLRLADGLPKSRDNSLPLPVALGLGVPPPDGDAPTAGDDAFNKIWRGQEGDWDKALEAMLKAPGANLDQIRAGFYDFLLRRVLDSTAVRGDIDRAARLMDRQGFKAAGVPRPAEAHLLVMTQAFFGDPRPQVMIGAVGEPPFELWKRALAVRRSAEGAALGVNYADAGRHPYSEHVWKFLGPEVEAADSRRRDGEDLLFSSTAQDRAGKEFDTAAKSYENILGRAKSMQAAYAARDAALADLPLLTRWIAAQPAKADAGGLEELKEFWITKVHALARQLNGGSPVGADALAEAVRTGLDKYKQAYAEKCRDLRARILQTQWEQLEQVLCVPFMVIDVNLRGELITASRTQVAKLSGEWVLSDKAVGGSKSAAPEAVKTDRRLQAVQWGELAAAVLGDLPTQQRSDAKGNLYDATGLRNGLVGLSADAWQTQVGVVGDQIGRHWQLLADVEAPKDNEQAEFRSRWSIAFQLPVGPEPATVNRHQRWQTLFVGLARRTAIDHWYEVEGRPDEYFRAAGKRYLDDAKQSVGDGTAAVPNERPVKDLFGVEKLRLEPVGFEQRVSWTSEIRRTLPFQVESKNCPNGYVTLWPEIAKSAPLTLNPDDLPRQPARLEGARRDLHVNAAPFATSATVPLAAHGYFRGQWFKNETTINLNRTPDVILARATPPNDAAVAVRGDNDLDIGAISIVLDFSGSMKATPDGKENPENPASKYRQALATLRQVLLGLPPGTPISLRLFGHEFDKARYNIAFAANAGLDAAEREEVSGSDATPSELIYQGAVKWSRVNPGPLESAILDKLEAKKPQYFTPLLRSMSEAKADFPPSYRETKTLLVLTDGSDNLYPKANRQARVKAELKKEFDDAGIIVQVVLFRVEDKEEKESLEQFGDLPNFKTPGRVRVAKFNDDLEKSIDLALRPNLRLVDRSGEAAKGLAQSGLPANRSIDDLTALRWTPGIDPGLYTGEVLRSRQPFDLKPGDRMLVRLKKDSLGVKFSRDLLADEPRLNEKGRVARNDQWALGLPYYHSQTTMQDKQLRLGVTLESLRGRSPGPKGTLQQTRPAFVWWDIAPQADDRPKTLRVEERWQIPAPAWTMVAEGWPGTANNYKPATIRAWIDLDAPLAAYRRIKINLTALAAGQVFVEETAVGDKDVKVQVFASLEEAPLRDDTNPNNDFKTDDPDKKSCLVIRVLHPDKKPVFVRPNGIDFAAYQQRFYSSSNAVTAVFGPITKEGLLTELKDQPLELDLISIEKFKTEHQPLILNMTGPAGSEQPLVGPPNLGKADKTP